MKVCDYLWSGSYKMIFIWNNKTNQSLKKCGFFNYNEQLDINQLHLVFLVLKVRLGNLKTERIFKKSERSFFFSRFEKCVSMYLCVLAMQYIICTCTLIPLRFILSHRMFSRPNAIQQKDHLFRKDFSFNFDSSQTNVVENVCSDLYVQSLVNIRTNKMKVFLFLLCCVTPLAVVNIKFFRENT